MKLTDQNSFPLIFFLSTNPLLTDHFSHKNLKCKLYQLSNMRSVTHRNKQSIPNNAEPFRVDFSSSYTKTCKRYFLRLWPLPIHSRAPAQGRLTAPFASVARAAAIPLRSSPSLVSPPAAVQKTVSVREGAVVWSDTPQP